MSGGGLSARLERHQVVVYLGAIALGVALGLLRPAAAIGLEPALTPLLVLLLTATFLAVPLSGLVQAWRSPRFLLVFGAVNLVLAPLVAIALALLVPLPAPVLLAVLLVLLAPCIDYVVTFTGIAGGSADRLLATTPLLMAGQLGLLALLLWWLLGADGLGAVSFEPLVTAFLLMIALPLLIAAVVQLAGRRLSAARALESFSQRHAMVPLMAATLLVVAASQVPHIAARLGEVLLAVPVFAAFALLMPLLAALAARAGRLSAPDGRAIAFSGATRNSLVVLPLALALPAGYEVAPAVVVTQTLVELVALVLLLRLVPRLLPARASGG